MMDGKGGHIPSPLIMFSCPALCHPLLEWQKNTGVHPKDSKSKLKADRPDPSNCFNYKLKVVRIHPAALQRVGIC